MKQATTILFMMLGMTLASAQSIKDLDFLVGKWEVSEIVYAGTDREYIETGDRECSYYLDGSYIKCETQGVRKGRNRSYTFLINYDSEKKYFRLLSLSSDYPDVGMSAWEINNEAQIIKSRSLQGYGSIHRLDFRDKNKIIWQGLYAEANSDSELELKAMWTETATRK